VVSYTQAHIARSYRLGNHSSRKNLKQLLPSGLWLQGKCKVLQDEHTRAHQTIRDYHAACEAHCEAWCKNFTKKIVTRLPRELRDMVYNYIFDQKKLHIDSRGNDYWIIEEQHSQSSYSGFEPPYLLHPSYTDLTFAAELSQVLWRLGRVHVGDARSLEAILLHDPFRTPTTPLDHIRRLAVQIYNGYDEFVTSQDGKESKLRPVVMREELPAAVTGFNILCASNTLEKLMIHIYGLQPADVRTVERALMPSTHRLAGKGVEVSVRDYSGQRSELRCRDYSRPLPDLLDEVDNESAHVSGKSGTLGRANMLVPGHGVN